MGVVIASVAIGVQVLVLSAGAWAFANRATVRDWLVVGKVVQTQTLEKYVDESGMSDAGRFYLYAAKPALHKSDTFSKACPQKEAGVAVLGCYIGKTDRIHLLDITDPAFDTMEPVVAAHEMLHAVWARFNNDERKRVADAVRATYASITDPALKERMAVYRSANGSVDVAELFAVLGTEVPLVSDDLNAVYNRYFDRRGAVVQLAVEASTVISTIVDEIKRVSTELVDLEATITAGRDAYEAGVAQLQADANAFNTHANTTGYYVSQSAFDRDRAALISRQSALEAQRVTINDQITQYNVLVGQLANLNDQAMALNKALGVDVSEMSPVTKTDTTP